MKSIRSMIYRIAVMGILFMLFTGTGAYADKDRIYRAGCPCSCGETVISRKTPGGYYLLSLPGNWDIRKMTLEMEGSSVIYLGGEKQEIRAGEEADLSGYAGMRIPVRDENQRRIGDLMIRQGSEIPALFLTVDAKELRKANRSKENEITEGRAVFTEADGTVSYDGGITQMKGRGNNTFAYNKKPYQIKLEKKASLSGMNRAKTWVLLANYNDVSMLRNQIVLDLAKETGMRYAVSCVQTDVWINGEYNGLYLLTEKIQIKKERIDLKDLEDATEEVNDADPGSYAMFKTKTETLPLMRGYKVPANPEDITGGYIFTIEKYARLRDYKVPGFRTKNELSIRIKEPTYPSREQTEYLGNLINDMHLAVIAEDGVSKATGKNFGEYIDVPSFALKYLIEEWTKNYDFFGGSQFLYKDADERDPLVYAGPAWDYDLAFGNMRDRGYSPEGNYLTAISRRTSNLYWLLSRHETFMQEVDGIWREKFRPATAILLGETEAPEGSVLRSLDGYAERIRKSAEMNYARWAVSRNTDENAGGSFDNAVAYLKRWITRRTAFMDEHYGITEKHE